ncbi:IclR family transcriptional regulator [Caballeronia sp. BR00000012568055]|uniref:IclR family transcriptional regulator n=1 Tax=Caballeronia sp. BR00000012568055 TaxID=2918761 RepID=UPI0023F63B3A|nr:IclR family transcriptional regulator [Caballeronia sp. BR00000012568055]
MSVALERGMAILELLSTDRNGMQLSRLSETLDIPHSATHRLLTTLIEMGYVYQTREMGQYCLSLKAVSLGIRFVSKNDLIDLARPLMDELASVSGELSRLGLIDNERLVWVSKSLGTRAGLRYDPDSGLEAPIFCTASGIVWLGTMPDDEVTRRVTKAGFAHVDEYGANAPRTLEEVFRQVRRARNAGWAMVSNSFEVNTAAMAALIKGEKQEPLGVLTIAGPSFRMTSKRMQELAPLLMRAAASLSEVNARAFAMPPASALSRAT